MKVLTLYSEILKWAKLCILDTICTFFIFRLIRCAFFIGILIFILQIEEIVRIYTQIVVENVMTYTKKIKVVELVDKEYTENNMEPIIEHVGNALNDITLVQPELIVVSEDLVNVPPSTKVENKNITIENNTSMFICANLLERQNVR